MEKVVETQINQEKHLKLLVARTTGAVVEEVVLPKLLVARTTGGVVEEVMLPKLLVQDYRSCG